MSHKRTLNISLSDISTLRPVLPLLTGLRVGGRFLFFHILVLALTPGGSLEYRLPFYTLLRTTFSTCPFSTLVGFNTPLWPSIIVTAPSYSPHALFASQVTQWLSPNASQPLACSFASQPCHACYSLVRPLSTDTIEWTQAPANPELYLCCSFLLNTTFGHIFFCTVFRSIFYQVKPHYKQ